jgi:uncharacterized membrane protein
MLAKTLLAVQLVSAIVLAAAFFLPIGQDVRWVSPEGRSVGILGLRPPAEDSIAVVTYAYPFEDAVVIVPLVFFLPLLLVVLRAAVAKRGSWLALDAGKLVAAALLVVPLFAMISVAGMFFSEAAYGGYVAIVALSTFVVASALRVVARAAARLRHRPTGAVTA